MYSVYKRNKQGDNIQPWYTPFPILNQSAVPRPVQTVASWLAYGFLRRQVKWSYSHLFKNFPQFVAIYTDLGVHRPEAALPLGIWAWTRGLHSPVMQALCVWAGDFGISGIWAWPRRWGYKPGSPTLQADSFPSEPPGKPLGGLFIQLSKPQCSYLESGDNNLPFLTLLYRSSETVLMGST